MLTSAQSAMDNFNLNDRDMKSSVPTSKINKEAAKNANWNLGNQPVMYVSTTASQYRMQTGAAPPSKQEQIERVNKARK